MKVKNKYQDVVLGCVSIYQSKGSEEPKSFVAKRVIYTDNVSQFEEFYKFNGQYVETKMNNHPNLWQIHSIYINEQGGEFLEPMNSINILYEFCQMNLEREIQQRKKLNLRYSEPDILIILYSILSAGCFLAK